MSPLRLIPNLGGEESASASPEEATARLRHAPVATAARLWSLLFPRDAELLAPEDSRALAPWPTLLEGVGDEAVFPALTPEEGAVAWLADEAAHALAHASGDRLAGVDAAVARAVNDKAFATEQAEEAGLVPRALRGCAIVLDPSDLTEAEAVADRITDAVATWPDWTRERIALKPRRGTSGRGTRFVRAAQLSGDTLSPWLQTLGARGGAVVEPWLERERDLSVQLAIAPDGGVTLLGALELVNRADGSFLGHRGEIDSRGRVFSGLPEEEELREAGALLASAAASVGYCGPVGVDAFSYRDPEAERIRLRPVVELNARFTMGIVAIGLVRRLLPRIREATGLSPGERRAFAFAPGSSWSGPGSDAADTRAFPLGSEGGAGPALIVSRNAESLGRALAEGDSPFPSGEPD